MSDLDDAEALAHRACKFGLITKAQIAQLQDEGEWDADGQRLVKILERKGILTPFQSQKLLKGETSGYILGGHRLLYKIASGTFGRVFRADDPNTGMIVAVKVLRQRWSDDSAVIELFEREGKVGLTLRHPNIVEILSIDRDRASGQHYIVMEFVEGGSLRDFITSRKKLTPIEALRLAGEAASGLAHSHSRGIAHRDIKPTNMLISAQGAVKLVDFGLACLYETGGAIRDQRARPTVDYAGLEKVTGVKTGDPRSDIYFLGCVLYEMLAGRPPLEATKDKNARQARQRFDSVKPLTGADVEAPQSLFTLVETMMNLDPLARYQNPNLLVEAIADVRREVESGASGGGLSGPTRSVFILEPNEKLQDAIRAKLKEHGFRVLLSADPNRAVARFQEQPFDALVVDAGCAGEPGVHAFRTILNEAEYRKHACAGILILSEAQTAWAEKVGQHPRMAILVRPVTLRQLYLKLQELLSQK
jgi:hypothetical protein